MNSLLLVVSCYLVSFASAGLIEDYQMRFRSENAILRDNTLEKIVATSSSIRGYVLSVTQEKPLLHVNEALDLSRSSVDVLREYTNQGGVECFELKQFFKDVAILQARARYLLQSKDLILKRFTEKKSRAIEEDGKELTEHPVVSEIRL